MSVNGRCSQTEYRLVESLTEKEFERAVIDYLNKHNVLHLATCRNNEPRSTPLNILTMA